MSFAQWKKEYVTGNQKIDDQHQHLFDIINVLHQAMTEKHGQDVIKKTLNDLLQYTIEHFTTEEMIMLYHHYPNYKEHKERHTNLTNKLKELAIKFEHSTHSINLEVLHLLNEWLAHHIKGEDKKLMKFLQEKSKQTQENSQRKLVKS